mmetsp:Transcript_50952/g.100153  ORF Transcript_50952/g.100153 Transcript_50952/m.100153 type:complete len:92 (+) Transcript_50952:613-888(+)
METKETAFRSGPASVLDIKKESTTTTQQIIDRGDKVLLCSVTDRPLPEHEKPCIEATTNNTCCFSWSTQMVATPPRSAAFLNEQTHASSAF